MSQNKKNFSNSDVITTEFMNQFVQETQIKSALSTDTEPDGYREIPSLKLVSDKFASVLEADGITAKLATRDGSGKNISETYTKNTDVIPASRISIADSAIFGNAATLQDVINYLEDIFSGEKVCNALRTDNLEVLGTACISTISATSLSAREQVSTTIMNVS